MDIPVSEVVRALHEENDEAVSVSCDKQTCKIQYKFIPDYYRKVNVNILKDSARDSSTTSPSSTTTEPPSIRSDISQQNIPDQFNAYENDQEAFIKQYIKTRFEIGNDISELEQRWNRNGKLDEMTSAPAYDAFLGNEKYGLGLIQRAKEEKLTRKVEINDLKYNSDRGYWVIDVSFFDTDIKNVTPIKTDWVISMDLKENFLYTTNPRKYPPFRVNNFGQRKK